MKKLRNGFTLVELIVAVVAIAVIAALAVGGVIAISMMFAIPKLIEDPVASMAANETAAIQRVESIWDAQGESEFPSFLHPLTEPRERFSCFVQFTHSIESNWK